MNWKAFKTWFFENFPESLWRFIPSDERYAIYLIWLKNPDRARYMVNKWHLLWIMQMTGMVPE